ncbi:MAG: exodeoxyribonuclease V subunit gamma, partial [Treponema sp.]|nr:exodeoxyribonuclease V subunit gamma [Treponema sp.]
MTGCELHTSFNLTALAEEMTGDIIKNWKNPFEPPVLLFSDRKVEQWFRQFWLKVNQGQNRALINLQSLATESFLFSMLADDDVKKLSTEFLCDYLVAKLPSLTENGVPYFKTLGSQEVTDYLTAGTDSDINETHLYDFSEQMAALLIDYETTRPAGYNAGKEKGLCAAWNSNEQFFDGSETEAWQRKLYQDVLGKPLVTDGRRYATLAYVFNDRRARNAGKPLFDFRQDTPVYLFGFSGMGQLHRTILQAFSKEHVLKVYLQGNISQEDAEQSDLITLWGGFGRENIAWWKSCSQSAGALQTASASGHLAKIAGNAVITAAASKIREIEYVHSKICSLLSADAPEGQEKLLQSDILVLAPDISAYRTAILEVFDQNSLTSAGRFPRVPYRILDLPASISQVCTAVHTLVSILKKGTITRPDFFTLVRSSFIQKIRGITPEMTDSWLTWAEQMSLYRTHNGKDDWQNGVKRLMLSRLTAHPVTADDGTVFIPYSDFDSADNASLKAFADCVQSLEDAIALCRACEVPQKHAELTGERLSALKACFDSWLLYTDSTDTSFVSEQIVYRHVTEEFERQAQLLTMQDGFETLPLNGVFSAIEAASSAASSSSTPVFTGGITFASFQPNRILPAECIFIMGLDSQSFPGTDRKNNLDLRKTGEPWDCDNSIPGKNRNAFLCQVMAAGKALFLSYVNNDLQKDEQFYSSSVIHELERFTGTDEKAVRQLTVDENRSWDELFTSRAFRNKRNFLKLKGGAQKENDSPSDAQDEEAESARTAAATAPDRVFISELVSFLSDPFQFRIGKLFSKKSADDAAESHILYEPIELSPLSKAQILSAMTKAMLKQKKAKPQTPISVSASEPYLEPRYRTASLYEAGMLPEAEPFGKKALDELTEGAQNLSVQLESLNMTAGTLMPEENPDLTFTTESG